jgi:hypothetical protein
MAGSVSGLAIIAFSPRTTVQHRSTLGTCRFLVLNRWGISSRPISKAIPLSTPRITSWPAVVLSVHLALVTGRDLCCPNFLHWGNLGLG